MIFQAVRKWSLPWRHGGLSEDSHVIDEIYMTSYLY